MPLRGLSHLTGNHNRDCGFLGLQNFIIIIIYFVTDTDDTVVIINVSDNSVLQ